MYIDNWNVHSPPLIMMNGGELKFWSNCDISQEWQETLLDHSPRSPQSGKVASCFLLLPLVAQWTAQYTLQFQEKSRTEKSVIFSDIGHCHVVHSFNQNDPIILHHPLKVNGQTLSPTHTTHGVCWGFWWRLWRGIYPKMLSISKIEAKTETRST